MSLVPASLSAQGAPEREYVYTAGSQSNRIFAFVAHPVTGALTQVPATPVTTTAGPSVLVGDAVRQSVYVAALGGTLARFNVDPATGALAATPPVSVPGLPEQGGALHPLLPVFYMTDPTFEYVRAYRVNAPCCITPIGMTRVYNNVHGAAVHPSGRFLYITTSVDDIGGGPNSHVWGFALDSGGPPTTALPGSPWLEGTNTTTSNAAIDPSGRFLYAVNRQTNAITGFAIDAASGALTRLPTAPFPTGGSLPQHLAITKSGTFLYATNTLSNTVSGFRVGTDGALTALTGSPFPAVASPQDLVVGGGDDRFLYVASNADLVVGGYAIDASTGALTPLPGHPFAAPGVGLGIALVRIPQEDLAPALTVDDVEVTEGHTGFVSAVFTVRLVNPPPGPVVVDYETRPGTAELALDFSVASGTLTFPPGVDSHQVFVEVHGDVLDEPDEFFSLELSDSAGVPIGDDEGFARIRDDDGDVIRLTSLERNADQVADLQARPGPIADEDLYLVRREPWSSYEVTVDGSSGDVGDAGPEVQWLTAEGPVISSVPVGGGPSRSLPMPNDLPVRRLDYVRVRSAGCTTDCGVDDTYRIRLRETTGRIPRFNQAGGQVTVLILQNRTAVALEARVSYWDQAGARLTGAIVPLGPRQSVTVPTPSLAQGTSGSITVTHDGPLDALAGKAVTLDPSGGLAFDTPLATRAR